MNIEHYFDMPYWVVDLLPVQVPEGDNGQFFEIEPFMIQELELGRRLTGVLLRLNCFEDFVMYRNDGETIPNPEPDLLKHWINECFDNHEILNIFLPKADTLLSIAGDDTCMTVYNPKAALLQLITELAKAEGLFVWQPPRKAN